MQSQSLSLILSTRTSKYHLDVSPVLTTSHTPHQHTHQNIKVSAAAKSFVLQEAVKAARKSGNARLAKLEVPSEAQFAALMAHAKKVGGANALAVQTAGIGGTLRGALKTWRVFSAWWAKSWQGPPTSRLAVRERFLILEAARALLDTKCRSACIAAGALSAETLRRVSLSTLVCVCVVDCSCLIIGESLFPFTSSSSLPIVGTIQLVSETKVVTRPLFHDGTSSGDSTFGNGSIGSLGSLVESSGAGTCRRGIVVQSRQATEDKAAVISDVIADLLALGLEFAVWRAWYCGSKLPSWLTVPRNRAEYEGWLAQVQKAPSSTPVSFFLSFFVERSI
mgnify:CR=1 FL=1